MTLWITLLTLLGSTPSIIFAAAPQHASPQEKPVLLLYYSPYCPYSMKVVDYLKQIHKSVPMKNVQNNAEAKKELRERGGKAQVPCLIIDGKPLYESQAIIQWLSEHKDVLDPS